MKRIFLPLSVFLLTTGVVWYAAVGPRQSASVLSPIAHVVERPLDKYTIDNLTKRQGIASQIVLDEAVATASAYTAYLFHYTSDGPTLSLSESGLRGAGKKVTGLAHIHNGSGPFPVIVQLRGYVEKEKYQPGTGTRRSAEVFASHGFISFAPDFLGYGGSDDPSEDVLEERFQTYVAILDLVASLPSFPMVDPDRIGIWAHSNGGQIALTVLEITRGLYPTTLWAPVTRAFPYSILFYTDEAEDKGKALRKKLSDFEKTYDVDRYTMVNYLDRIAAPLQLHQGDSDEAVPVKWNDEFVADLRKKNITIGYFLYPGTDHNLHPVWNTVIARDLDFFTHQFTAAGRR